MEDRDGGLVCPICRHSDFGGRLISVLDSRGRSSFAQTIALGSRGLHFLYRRGKDPHADVALGALLPSLFWVAQWASFAFPGAEGSRPNSPRWYPA